MQDENSGRDRELETILATYTAIEPRPGLEQRVLANLRAKQQLDAARSSRRGPVLAALAVAVTVAVVSLSWLTRSKVFDSPTGSDVASRAYVASDSWPAGAAQSDLEKPRLEGRPLQGRVQPTRREKAGTSRPGGNDWRKTKTAVELMPRLERFPAPEPLSEQEKLLVRFAEDDPQEATLVAEARAEQLQREDEELKALARDTGSLQQER